MRHETRQAKTTLLASCALLAGLMLPAGSAVGDDTQLFQVNVAPNVMFIVDNSWSMNNVVWHPAYHPNAVYDPANCSTDPNDPNYHDYCLAHPLCNVAGDTDLSGSNRYWIDNNNQLIIKNPVTSTECFNTRTVYEAPDADSFSEYTLWGAKYLSWYFSDNVEDDYDLDGDGVTDGTILSQITSTTNGVRSQCLVDKGYALNYPLYIRSRMGAAKEILHDVICNTNQNKPFRYGLAIFKGNIYTDTDAPGGFVKIPPADFTSSHETALGNAIDGIHAVASTPLSETLYNVYRFFQSRQASTQAFGKDGTTRFPAYNLTTSGYVGTPPAHPVTADCQQHFIVLITDGEPTWDDFSDLGQSTFLSLIGDYVGPNDEDETPPNVAMAPGLNSASCSGNASDPLEDSCKVSLYLDDIGKFIHEEDFMLEAAYPDTQTIDLYTVGFTTTPVTNDLLNRAATQGGGQSFFSNDAEELATSIADALNDIEAKISSFAAASVPASRTSVGNQLYYSYFVPDEFHEIWEGHLKDFDFSSAGEILTPAGNCAVGDDPTAVPPCPANGLIRQTAAAHWDAATAMPAPGSRSLYFGEGDATPFARPTAWTTANVAAADLALVASDLSDVPYDTASDLEDLADKIVKALQGCEFGTDCTPRTNEDGAPKILGDIFHSNPLVVGNPGSAINEASYRSFTLSNRDRDRILYAGANDGFLHAFHAGDWHIWVNDDGVTPLIPPRYDAGTGVEQFGFMPSEIRTTIKSMLAEGEDTSDPGPDHLSVDGSPVAADVWLYRDFSNGAALAPLDTPEDKVEAQWRTVLMGGLREGGRSYYALDVTDPSAATYPRYLWEFPCDAPNCASAMNSGVESWEPYMGQTWSEPVITKVRVNSDTGTDPRGYERWVAVFGAGYDTHGDPNHTDYDWDPTTASPRGRAIFMVDITTGKVLAVKHFSDTAVSVNGTQRGYPEMRYAIASAPAVFDLDFDGFADVIYIGDLGGNMWKWVVSAKGDDPINNSSSDDNEAQPNWPFRIVFRGSASVEPPANHALVPADPSGTHFQSFFFPPTGVLRQGTLVIAFGAGERAEAERFENDGLDINNNHLYVVRDSDPYERSGSLLDPVLDYYSELDLATNTELNTLDCNTLQATKQGYVITGRDAEKFITNSVIFLGDLITGSFIPPDPSATDPCNATGTAYLYRFNVDCGTGAYPSNPGSGNEDRRRALGSGMPTRPRVSVGSLNQGGGGGGCQNRVVVITSDGAIDNDCAGDPPSSGTGLRSWRTR
jgi:Tfp pilus tip-associated adhesin PilY1